MEGRGTLFYPNGQKAYVGEWFDDKFNGHGIVYNETMTALNGEFNFKDFDFLGDYWISFEGQFKDDNKEGEGVLIISNGERFNGTFQNDLVHGKGIFFKKDGKSINGEWMYNKLIRIF